MNTVLNRSDLHCALCGNSLRALARFCDACGSPINSRHAALERNQVTTLFADVVESMRLAATLESERLREIIHQLLNLSAAVIQRYRGTVDKFTGDGLMAMFGAPVALEDHAVRACIAAVEIQSIARVLAEEVRRRDNVDLQLRIGLNSDDVIAGEMGSAPNSYTVSGYPVGMAQRMESAAAAGGILCSESTARLAQPSVVFGPWSSFQSKAATNRFPRDGSRGSSQIAWCWGATTARWLAVMSADWAVSVRSSSKQFSSSACPPTIQAEKLNCARCDAAIRDTRAAPRPSSCSASPERSAAT